LDGGQEAARYVKGSLDQAIIFRKHGGKGGLRLTVFIVALSTCEAEYVAAAMAVCQAVWLRRLMGKLTCEEAHPPALMVDNQPAIALAKNPVLHNRSKHIDTHFHFIRDCVDGGQIVLEFVKTGG